jgi:cytochrome c biogenesis protein CcmG/thiol:disulfide interchange protein DsbE
VTARKLKLGAQAAAVAVVAGLLAILGWRLSHQGSGGVASAVAHGKRPAAPGFDLPRLDGGGNLSLASLRGKVVVLNFWASWCAPCKQEAPHFESTWEQYRSRGVVVVGVDVNDFTGDAKHFAHRYGVTYPLLHDGSGKTLGPYGVSLLPETFVIDRSGHVLADRVPGEVTGAQLDASVQRALRS